MEVGVVGTGAWGTTLAVLAARAGHEAVLLARDPQEADQIDRARENERRRPGLELPAEVSVTADPARLHNCPVVVLAVPAASLPRNVEWVRAHIGAGAAILCAAKGLEPGTGRTVSEVTCDAGIERERVLVLSGPNFSAEIAAGLPAATVIAGRSPERRALAQAAFMSDRFRVYTSDDIVGVELGGALKNVVAIACGIADGLGSGQNAKAALMTRALAEIARLGVACGARALTFLGLAGIGDLIATCESDLSRNRRLGLLIAAGKSLQQAEAEIDGVVEGVGTTRAVAVLAEAKAVEMPIAEELHRVLFEGKAPLASMVDLMRRAPKDEFPEF